MPERPNHVQVRACAKFPDRWEVWVSDDGRSWRMLGYRDKAGILPTIVPEEFFKGSVTHA